MTASVFFVFIFAFSLPKYTTRCQLRSIDAFNKFVLLMKTLLILCLTRIVSPGLAQIVTQPPKELREQLERIYDSDQKYRAVSDNGALFLVIQHADLTIQEKYLPLMRVAVANKKAKVTDLALLEDRVLMRQNKQQIYGSQVRKDSGGGWIVHPIEGPANVDKRRSEIGLEPIVKYLSRFGMVWNLEEHLRQQNEK